VKGQSGTGDAKAMVQITPAVGGTFSQRQAYMGPDGRFEASGLAAGTYYVTVPMQNGQFNLAGILAGAAKRTNEGQTVVTLTEGQVVDLDLRCASSDLSRRSFCSRPCSSCSCAARVPSIRRSPTASKRRGRTHPERPNRTRGRR
jgi:hypothetical protein